MRAENDLRQIRAVHWTALGAVSFLALLVGVLVITLRPAGGLNGRYSILRPEGTTTLVHQRVDKQLNFAVSQGLDAAYIFNWDIERLSIPSAMPPYLIQWRGFLLVPETGVYGFWLDAQGISELHIGDQAIETRIDALTETSLRAGIHAIEVDYRLTEGDARLVLNWRPPGGSLEPIPSRFLGPDPGSFARVRRTRMVGFGVLILALAALVTLILLARKGNRPAAEMAARLMAGRTVIALGAILILAGLLRFHDYTLVPFHHETADEYQHAWEGWHLLHTGKPVAWSTFPDRYPPEGTNEFRWFGDPYVLVNPYFDHPPLFSVLVGLTVGVGQAFGVGPPPGPGAAGFLSSTLPVMRFMPILLSLVGVPLVYRLAREYGATERAALSATLVYASLPVIVLGHRLVKAESLLAVLMMGAILLAYRHQRSGAVKDALLAGLLCGLSIWTKATGIAVIGTVVILLLAARRYRGAVVATAVTGGFVLLYLIYAAAYDFDIFLSVIHAQSTTKWASLDSFLDLMSGKVVVKWFGRGWYLWLLLAAGVAALRKERALLIPIAIYVTLIAITADHRVIYGWYRIPLFAFLCIAAGIYLDEMMREADLYRVFPFAATAVVTGLLYSFSAAPFSSTVETASRNLMPNALVQTKPAVAFFSVLALAPYLLRLAFDRPWTRRLATGATYLLIALFFLTSVASVGGMLETYHITRGVR